MRVFEYNGNEVSFDFGQGVMINATQMAKAFGKAPKDYLKTQSAKDLIKAVSARTNVLPTDLVTVINGGTNYGTWMEETIALDFAQWLSVDFKLWCSNVIKEVLKYGSFSFEIPQTLSQALMLAAKQAEEIETQAKQIEIQEPKVEVFEKIANADTLLSLNEAAKAVGTGRNRLMRVLRNNKVLTKTNVPYQRYIERGLFLVKVSVIQKGNTLENYAQTFVTGKGLVWIAKSLKN